MGGKGRDENGKRGGETAGHGSDTGKYSLESGDVQSAHDSRQFSSAALQCGGYDHTRAAGGVDGTGGCRQQFLADEFCDEHFSGVVSGDRGAAFHGSCPKGPGASEDRSVAFVCGHGFAGACNLAWDDAVPGYHPVASADSGGGCPGYAGVSWLDHSGDPGGVSVQFLRGFFPGCG